MKFELSLYQYRHKQVGLLTVFFENIGNNNTCFKKICQQQLCLPILCDHYFLRYTKTNLYSLYHRPL